MPDTFQSRADMLNKLGVLFAQQQEYRPKEPPRSPHDVELFEAVVLPFTPNVWCRLCMNEGDFYIGGCCGSSSAVQDKLDHIFRFDSGRIRCKDLAEIAEAMVSHDGGGSPTYDEPFWFGSIHGTLEEAVERVLTPASPELDVTTWSVMSPWDQMALIWHIVKDHYSPEPVYGDKDGEQPEPERLMWHLQNEFQYWSIGHMFDRDKPRTDQQNANDMVALARILPDLKKLSERVDELKMPPMDGFALWDKERGGIARNHFGLCLYKTQEEVDQIMNLWRQTEKQYTVEGRRGSPVDDRIEIRPVRVTSEGGIEFPTS